MILGSAEAAIAGKFLEAAMTYADHPTALQLCAMNIIYETKHGVMEDYEVEHRFPTIGKRTMLLNARKVFYEGNSHTTLLLGIEDVTTRRALEREREDLLRKQQALLREKDVLLEELQHRVGNSLQIIAAIILMKSRMGHLGGDSAATPGRT